jgi:hypothetical protein
MFDYSEVLDIIKAEFGGDPLLFPNTDKLVYFAYGWLLGQGYTNIDKKYLLELIYKEFN